MLSISAALLGVAALVPASGARADHPEGYFLLLEVTGPMSFTALVGEVHGLNLIPGQQTLVSPSGDLPPRPLSGVLKFQSLESDSSGPFDWFQLALQGSSDEAIAEVAITLYDRDFVPVAGWVFREAWPTLLSGISVDPHGVHRFDDFQVEYRGLVNRWGDVNLVSATNPALLQAPATALEKAALEEKLPALKPKK
jgi:hypothetical protein